MTKDSGFIDMVCRLGHPPQIIWITCGNVTNRHLQQILQITLPVAILQLNAGEPIVEIGDKPSNRD